ncbi:hypothetical protein QAD02_022787 [Eretmocerus hayati]|uniref:Uncharacterized protein n=1 Tax=Eretmocerus hayati TaxID=131215 RepID=A0ACC2PU28_9HYME|nr:hypothetical protein QAD02_022787 [Eretmocerus hayati]
MEVRMPLLDIDSGIAGVKEVRLPVLVTEASTAIMMSDAFLGISTVTSVVLVVRLPVVARRVAPLFPVEIRISASADCGSNISDHNRDGGQNAYLRHGINDRTQKGDQTALSEGVTIVIMSARCFIEHKSSERSRSGSQTACSAIGPVTVVLIHKKVPTVDIPVTVVVMGVRMSLFGMESVIEAIGEARVRVQVTEAVTAVIVDDGCLIMHRSSDGNCSGGQIACLVIVAVPVVSVGIRVPTVDLISATIVV